MKKYDLGLYEKAMPNNWSFAKKFQQAKKAGFDYVEISIDESDAKLARLAWSKSERAELCQLMFEHNCYFKSMCLSGHRRFPLGSPDESKRVKGMEMMHQAIDLAMDLGVRIIQLAGYDTYYDKGTTETELFFIENLKRSTEYAAQKGVLLGFETMETPFMDTVGKAMKYVDIVNSPYLGVYPDIGNLQNSALIYGLPAHEDIAKGRRHNIAAHLKETIPGHYREIPFGTGHTDYANTIAELWGQGVRTFVGEFWYLDGQDAEAELNFANNFLRKKIESTINNLI